MQTIICPNQCQYESEIDIRFGVKYVHFNLCGNGNSKIPIVVTLL